MRDLSILIPTFNDECSALVSGLQQQAEALGIRYEIIVADDGSTHQAVIEANRAVNQLPHCRLTERKENSGRAAIRNFLVRQAQYDWLVFIDSDMVICRDDYLRRYAEAQGDVVDGGVVIGGLKPGNLRSMYEKAKEHEHTVEKRQQSPYQDFHTANFMVRRDIILQHPFDSRFHHYGYEDVLFGKALYQHDIVLHHIDNPMSFEVYESNAGFVSKTEEGLRTLAAFSDELRGYSRLLAICDKLAPIAPLIRLWHWLFGSWERRQLTSQHPSLTIFSIYKLGYLLAYCHTKRRDS